MKRTLIITGILVVFMLLCSSLQAQNIKRQILQGAGQQQTPQEIDPQLFQQIQQLQGQQQTQQVQQVPTQQDNLQSQDLSQLIWQQLQQQSASSQFAQQQPLTQIDPLNPQNPQQPLNQIDPLNQQVPQQLQQPIQLNQQLQLQQFLQQQSPNPATQAGLFVDPNQQQFQQPLPGQFPQNVQQPLQQPAQQPIQQPILQQQVQQQFQQPFQIPFQLPLQQPLQQPLQPWPQTIGDPTLIGAPTPSLNPLFTSPRRANPILPIRPISINRCLAPMQYGSCRGRLIRWGFNPRLGRCVRYLFSGCGIRGQISSPNNFASLAACRHSCVTRGPSFFPQRSPFFANRQFERRLRRRFRRRIRKYRQVCKKYRIHCRVCKRRRGSFLRSRIRCRTRRRCSQPSRKHGRRRLVRCMRWMRRYCAIKTNGCKRCRRRCSRKRGCSKWRCDRTSDTCESSTRMKCLVKKRLRRKHRSSHRKGSK